jgi:hypothetical protein
VTRSSDSLREQALRRLERKRKFQAHVLFYCVGMAVLLAVWALTEYQNAGGWPTGFRTGRQNHDWDPWIVYPLIGGSVLLAVDAWQTFRRGPISELDVRREMQRLGALD